MQLLHDISLGNSLDTFCCNVQIQRLRNGDLLDWFIALAGVVAVLKLPRELPLCRGLPLAGS